PVGPSFGLRGFGRPGHDVVPAPARNEQESTRLGREFETIFARIGPFRLQGTLISREGLFRPDNPSCNAEVRHARFLAALFYRLVPWNGFEGPPTLEEATCTRAHAPGMPGRP